MYFFFFLTDVVFGPPISFYFSPDLRYRGLRKSKQVFWKNGLIFIIIFYKLRHNWFKLRKHWEMPIYRNTGQSTLKTTWKLESECFFQDISTPVCWTRTLTIFMIFFRLLYKRIICDLDEIRNFDQETGVIGLELFKELCDFMCTSSPSDLPKFLSCTGKTFCVESPNDWRKYLDHATHVKPAKLSN